MHGLPTETLRWKQSTLCFSERSLTLAVGISRVEVEGKLVMCSLQDRQERNKYDEFDLITPGGPDIVETFEPKQHQGSTLVGLLY